MKHKDLQNKEYISWKKFLNDSETWSLERIHEYELSEIKRICEFAYENTLGYKKLFDKHEVNPKSLNLIEDFKRFPFTTKQHFQDNLEEFSAQVKDRFYVTTGGSTGIPMGMYRDPVSFAKELASKAHQYQRIGWEEGDKQFVIRGLPIKTPDHTEFVEEFNELRCSTYQFVPEHLENYQKKALDYEPEWLRCYPSAGYLFAGFLKENNLKFPKLKGILCASEMLFDFQKDLMQEVFQTRVFSHYGHYEMAALAGFCENNDDYHVLPQYGFVELIDKNGNSIIKKGQIGEIVATSFIMHATLFIRYKTGDLAVLKGWNCESCGRPYQILEKVIGRRQEMIVSKIGRMISTTMLNMHDDIYDDLRQFQFYQDQKGKLTFRFVPKNNLNQNKLEEIKKRLFVKLGDDFELKMLQVQNIELTKRGKHKALIQKLELDYENQELLND